MPRWLRQFTFNKINEFYQEKAKEHEKASSKGSSNKSTLVDSSGNVNKQAFKQASPKTASSSKVKYK